MNSTVSPTVRLRGRPVVYSQYGTHESLCLTPPYHISKDEHESIKWVEVMSKTEFGCSTFVVASCCVTHIAIHAKRHLLCKINTN